MKNKEIVWRNYLKKIGLVVGFVIFLLVTFRISFQYLEKQSEREVTNPVPDSFRLFVASGDKFEIIRFDELEAFKKSNPNFSFLVPKEKLNAINEKLYLKALNERVESVPKVTIENESADRQTIKISHGGDGIYNFRYEAGENAFRPLTINIQGPGFVFGPCCVTGVLGFVVFYGLRFILWYLKKRQKKVEESGENYVENN